MEKLTQGLSDIHGKLKEYEQKSITESFPKLEKLNEAKVKDISELSLDERVKIFQQIENNKSKDTSFFKKNFNLDDDSTLEIKLNNYEILLNAEKKFIDSYYTTFDAKFNPKLYYKQFSYKQLKSLVNNYLVDNNEDSKNYYLLKKAIVIQKVLSFSYFVFLFIQNSFFKAVLRYNSIPFTGKYIYISVFNTLMFGYLGFYGYNVLSRKLYAEYLYGSRKQLYTFLMEKENKNKDIVLL